MKTEDHLLLADRLLAQTKNDYSGTFAAGLRTGSVLPDCNPFTYLRGIGGGQGVHGHNAEVTRTCICRLLERLQCSRERDFLFGLRLGTALHYIADAFTYPHHAYYTGTLAEHVAYEASLHRIFAEYVGSGTVPSRINTAELPTYFEKMLAVYEKKRKNALDDCRYINRMCSLAFQALTAQPEKEVIIRENPDYDRPLPSVR